MPTYSGVWTLPAQMQAVGQSLWPAQLLWYFASLSGSGNSYSYGAAVASSGTCYVGGDTYPSSAPDAYSCAINQYGQLVWQRQIGIGYDDFYNSAAVDSSGNAYFAGFTTDISATPTRCLVTKYNSSGVVQLQLTLGGGSGAYDVLGDCSVDSSGNIYVSGQTTEARSLALTAKYNSAGTLQWQRKCGNAASTYGVYGNGGCIDSSGNVYTTGYVFDFNTFANNGYVVKYNTSGTFQWHYTLGALNFSHPATDSSGNLYAGGDEGTLIKFNSSGVIQWQRNLAGVSVRKCAVASDDSVYIAGYGPSSNGFIAKYNSSGTLQWQRTISRSSGELYLESIALGPNGDMYVTGREQATVATYSNIFSARLPNDGTLTGTYGVFTYASSAMTASTPAYSTSAPSFSSATASLTASTASLTEQAGTLTFSKTNI